MTPVIAVQAETVSICGQKVEYKSMTPEASVVAKAREALGVWVGEYANRNAHNNDYTRCIGLVVETVTPTGAVFGKYIFGDSLKVFQTGTVYSTPPSVTSLGGDSQVTGDVLRVQGKTFSYEVQLTGANRVQGAYTDIRGVGRIWLKRAK